jgi:hypothetical protein
MGNSGISLDRVRIDAMREELVRQFREQYLLFSAEHPQRAFDLFVRGLALPVSELSGRLASLLCDLEIASEPEDWAASDIRASNLSTSNSTDLIASKIRLFPFCELLIATDHLWYNEPDFREGMAMPMHPENMFISRAIPVMTSGSILDIGFGSGVLGLLALTRGGSKLTGLEVSLRCQRFAKFNALLNGIDLARCNWHVNDVINPDKIFSLIENQRFDLIVCNPPYEIGRDEPELSLTLANGGSDGLSYFHEILPKINSYLTDHGEAHLVFFSVGDANLPRGILDIAERSEGSIDVFWLHNSLETADFHLWNTGRSRVFPKEQSRLWMGRIVVRRSQTRELRYQPLPTPSDLSDWHLPLYATTPIGYNPHVKKWVWEQSTK